MDFEKETLYAYLDAVSSEQFERYYSPDWLNWLRIDFWFPVSRIGINYTDGDRATNASLQAYKDKGITKYLTDNGIHLQSFEVGDVCKNRILELVPRVCDGGRINRNEEKIAEIMKRFIKTIMAEIQEEEADFSQWTNDGEEYGYDPKEEKPVLEVEGDEDTINAGENENATESPHLIQVEA